jgi:hypothetical protein
VIAELLAVVPGGDHPRIVPAAELSQQRFDLAQQPIRLDQFAIVGVEVRLKVDPRVQRPSLCIGCAYPPGRS